MNSWVKFAAAFAVLLLGACSTQHVKPQGKETDAVAPARQPEKEALTVDSNDGFAPPLTMTKDNKKLNLVRIMDGGICINHLQGARGSFLVYADPDDIERIKREKPKEIFNDFELKIQNFSSEVLEKAIKQMDLSIDPFSLGDDVMQQKLAEQLIINFRAAAQPSLSAFKRETTLTIDVAPFSPSLIFYQKGCAIGDTDHID
ncbi:MAG: hypothetical protein ACU83V_09070 [Gammaproteobacteria bacterium]